jgi:hypothetical protein
VLVFCDRSNILSGVVASWLVEVGASPAAIRELQLAVPELPVSYLELLSIGNGGEAHLQVSPGLLCLDSAEQALSYWHSGTYPMSGIFVFGGNGGGELIAFDFREPGKSPVVRFDPIDPEGSLSQIASGFEELIALVGGSDV